MIYFDKTLDCIDFKKCLNEKTNLKKLLLIDMINEFVFSVDSFFKIEEEENIEKYFNIVKRFDKIKEDIEKKYKKDLIEKNKHLDRLYVIEFQTLNIFHLKYIFGNNSNNEQSIFKEIEDKLNEISI